MADIDGIVKGIEEKAHTAVDESTAGVDSIFLREATEVITRITQEILGFASVIIIVTIPIIVALELAYVVFPIMRGPADNLFKRLDEVNVKRFGIVKRTVEFTFRDARQAVFESTTTRIGTSPVTIYLGLKLKSVMFIVLMLDIVLLGADDFFVLVSHVFKGIIDLVNGWF